MNKYYMILIDVDLHSDARKVCEDLQSLNFVSNDEAIKVIGAELGVEPDCGYIKGVSIFDMDTFMDGVNDQDIDDLTGIMIGYITIGL